jgi:hypothetical protein
MPEQAHENLKEELMQRSSRNAWQGFTLGTCLLFSLTACSMPSILQLSSNTTPLPTPQKIVIHPPAESLTPTPVDAPYKVAAWASDDTPQTHVMLYARFTHYGIPVAGAFIKFVIHYPGNNVVLSGVTDDDGMVAVATAAGNGPVIVDVYASYEGIRSHNTAFFYGMTLPTPTPTTTTTPRPDVTP